MNVLEKVAKQQAAMKGLTDRMDTIRDFCYNTPYTLKGPAGEELRTKSISVTLPYGALIANTIINDIMQAKLQTSVVGQVSKTHKNYIEGYVNDARDEGDESNDDR